MIVDPSARETAAQVWSARVVVVCPTDHLRLRVFEANRRARRFYAKLGWAETEGVTRSTFEPHPVLIEYRLER